MPQQRADYHAKRRAMSTNLHQYSLDKKYRTGAFFQTEVGKKWKNYDGHCSLNQDFRNDYNDWLGKPRQVCKSNKKKKKYVNNK